MDDRAKVRISTGRESASSGQVGGREERAEAALRYEDAAFAPPGKARRPPVCYFTAACLLVRGAMDAENCYEVRLFRLFCGEYVRKLPGGDGLIEDYHDEAWRAVRTVERRADAREIYLDTYERFVMPGVLLILAGRWEEAYEHHQRMRRVVEGRVSREV